MYIIRAYKRRTRLGEKKRKRKKIRINTEHMAEYGPPPYKRPEEICIRLHRRSSSSSVETNSAAAVIRFWPRVKTEAAKNNTPSSTAAWWRWGYLCRGRRKIVTGPFARACVSTLLNGPQPKWFWTGATVAAAATSSLLYTKVEVNFGRSVRACVVMCPRNAHDDVIVIVSQISAYVSLEYVQHVCYINSRAEDRREKRKKNNPVRNFEKEKVSFIEIFKML